MKRKSAKSFATVNVNPTIDMPEHLIGRVKENTLTKPTMPYHPTLTSSSVHNSSDQLPALQCHLNDCLLLKRDVKQQITIT